MTTTTKTDDSKAEVKEEKSQRQLEIERLRRTRVAPGIASRNLEYPSREGYVRRVVCDRHGRLEKFTRGGWAYVTEDQLEEKNPGTLKASTREGVDSRVSQVVGTHKNLTPMTGYLMEIPEELYQEDQDEKMDRLDALEGSLRAGADADGSGKAGTPQNPGHDGRYVGRQGIKIQQKGRRR